MKTEEIGTVKKGEIPLSHAIFSQHIVNTGREELAGQVVVAKFATTTSHGAIEGKAFEKMKKRM